MVTYLSRLSLFILLTCSFNSFAKYSEAMCILYKQQMQQYSDNTSSRSYRNAARDYDKNCSNPPPAKKSQVSAVPSKSTVPEPVTAIVEHSSSQAIEQPSVAVNPLDSKAEETAAQAKPSEAIPSETISSETIPSETAAATVVEASEVSTTEVEATVEPIKEPVEPLNQQPENTPAPTITHDVINNDAETGSLLMPSLLLLAVLLLAGLLLLRLRAKKNITSDSIEGNVATPLASTSANKPNKDLVADENKQTVTAQPTVQQPSAENDLTSTEPQASALDDIPKQAQLTPRIFSNEHDFKEPEVRTFDPDAPLPGPKTNATPEIQASDETVTHESMSGETELTADAVTHTAVAELDENTTTIPFVEAQQDDEIVDTKQAETKEFAVDIAGSEQQLNSAEEIAPHAESLKQDLESIADHTVENDSDDDLAKALAALNEELAAEQQPKLESNEHEPVIEQGDTVTAEQKANPFANLSLDPSWDPNSPEKPTIVPKKKVPKSAELIAAQERAKQLKTDD